MSARSLGQTLTDLESSNVELEETNRATSRFVPFQFLQLLSKESIRDIVRGDQEPSGALVGASRLPAAAGVPGTRL